MTDQAKPDRSLPPVAIAAALIIVVLAIGIVAFMVFGPKPEPHARYNSAMLIQKGQKDINSLTPDERRVYDHIMQREGGAPQFKGAPPKQ